MDTTILRLWNCKISYNWPLKSLHAVWYFCYLWPLWQRSVAFLLELPCQEAKSLPIIALLLNYLRPNLWIFSVLFFCPTLKNINNLAINCTATKYSTLICQTLHNITTSITDQKLSSSQIQENVTISYENTLSH